MNLSSAPAYSIAHKPLTKASPDKNYPGPGSYHAHEHDSSTSPSWKIGTSKRAHTKIQFCQGGPGSYHLSQQNSHSPSYTFSLKNKPDKIDLNPGPGEYQITASSMNRTCALKFGKTKKLVDRSNDGPGPGSYLAEQQKQNLSKGVKFTTSLRGHLQQRVENPGPGSYNVNENFRCLLPQIELSFGSGSKQIRKSQGDNPGPGKYEIEGWFDSKFKNKKESSMSKCDRTMYDEKFLSTQPGPGYYQLRDFLSKNTGATMSKAKRSQHYDSNPGPQKYDISEVFENNRKGTSFGHQKRYPSMPKNFNPGPGSYNNTSSIGSGPLYSLPKSKTKPLMESMNKNLVGPADYSPNYARKGQYIHFGNQKRKLNVQNSDDSPGPGQYHIRAEIKQGITIPQARVAEVVNEMPGPGQYEIQTGVGNVPQYYSKFKRK